MDLRKIGQIFHIAQFYCSMENRRSFSASMMDKRVGIFKKLKKYSLTSNKSTDVDSTDEDWSSSNKKFASKDKKYSTQSSTSSMENDVFSTSEVKSCRVLFLGSSSVGKTSIIKRYLNQYFPLNPSITVQDMFRGDLVMSSGANILLEIEDTGGYFYDDFPAMTSLSIRNSDVIVLVYSVCDHQSFEDISQIRDSIISKYDGAEAEPPPMLIVGSKVDQERSDQLPFHQIEAVVCLDWEAGYVECSAKEDINIEAVFNEAILQTKMFPRGVDIQPRLKSTNFKQKSFFGRMLSSDSLLSERRKKSSTESDKSSNC